MIANLLSQLTVKVAASRGRDDSVEGVHLAFAKAVYLIKYHGYVEMFTYFLEYKRPPG